MNSSTLKYIFAATLGLALCAAVWIATRPTTRTLPNGSMTFDFQKAAAPIYDLHKAQKWSEAKDRWAEMSKDERLTDAQRLEVEQNSELAEKLAESTKNKWERADGDVKGKPETPLTEAEIIAKYPVGRTIRNVAAFDIQGTGTNKQWFLKSQGHFAFRITNQARTEVIENTGNKVVLRVKFEEASQVLAVSEIDEVKLEWPPGRLAELSIEVADGLLMDVPLYSRIRWAIDNINKLDPNLKRTLTYAAKQFKANGVDLAASPNGAELIAQVEQLSGKEFEISYVRVVGVTKIECLHGAILPQETLDNLAYNSSLVMDAYLGKVLELQDGESLPLNAKDVAGLIGGGYRASASGELELGRTDKKGTTNDSVQLELKGKTPVMLTFDERNGPVRMSLMPSTSELTYSAKAGLVTSAVVDWNINLDTIPNSLLLHGTTNIQARCRTNYEAVDVTKK